MKRLCAVVAILGLLIPALAPGAEVTARPDKPEADRTLVVSAEGLADPNADTYQRDKGLLLDALRADAKKQVLEKAVGAYVESSTLVENYALVSDRVFSRAQGLIKQVIKESDPWIGEDGFAHLLMKAEVYVGGVEDALKSMSRDERVALLKERGNPRVAVSIEVADADRGSGVAPTRGQTGENILKERLKSFGYRVWSEGEGDPRQTPDFRVKGEAKFKAISAKLPASGLTVTKYALTSLTIRVIDAVTGEEVLHKTQVPKKQTWPDEDQAMEEVGRMVGAEMSRELFENHLSAPTRIYQLEVAGLPGHDVAQLLRKEFLGLRAVLNADLRSFEKGGASFYEVEFAGGRGEFSDFLDKAILEPLNKKVGAGSFSLESAKGDAVRLAFASEMTEPALAGKFKELAPASVTQAAPQRLAQLVQSSETLKKVVEIAPEAAAKMSGSGQGGLKTGMDAVKGF